MTPSPLASLLLRAAEHPKLRDYQVAEVRKLADAVRSGSRRPLCQLPTGAGKTVIGSTIAKTLADAGLRVLILATRTRLVRQWHQQLAGLGARAGVIAAQAPHLRDFTARVQIASADTLHRRCMTVERMPLPGADVVIFDEAHLAAADTRLGLLEGYPGALRLGFSATPARRSGRGLGAVFDSLVCGPSIDELTRRGVLVPAKVFSSPIVTADDLAALPKDATSDYAPGALGHLLMRPRLAGDVVQNWLRIAAGKRTFLFAVNKAHGAALAEEFSRAGVAAELLTDADDEATRDAAIARLESGATQVLLNCFLMSYGVDVPSLEAVVLARPTRSLAMYLQMVGRGLRPSPGKEHCLLIDHGRVIENLGLPNTPIAWSLDDETNVNREAERRTSSHAVERPRTCPECGHVWLITEFGSACRECGWAPAPKAREVAVEEVELEEIGTHSPYASIGSPEFTQFVREAIGYGAQRKPDKWAQRPSAIRAAAWHAAREKFDVPDGSIPRWAWGLEPLPPSEATAGYMTYRRIRFAKSRRAA